MIQTEHLFKKIQEVIELLLSYSTLNRSYVQMYGVFETMKQFQENEYLNSYIKFWLMINITRGIYLEIKKLTISSLI